MSAVAMELSAQDFIVASKFLNGIPDSIDVDKVELGMAAVVESQTKRRIASEKTAPDGDPWADWSPSYAETRHDGHSLLQGNNDLLTSIAFDQQGGQTIVGTPLVYAAIHQFGGEAGRNQSVDIVARPYFGISDDNEAELEEILFDYVQTQLQIQGRFG